MTPSHLTQFSPRQVEGTETTGQQTMYMELFLLCSVSKVLLGSYKDTVSIQREGKGRDKVELKQAHGRRTLWLPLEE